MFPEPREQAKAIVYGFVASAGGVDRVSSSAIC